jgi:hypothetical protein
VNCATGTFSSSGALAMRYGNQPKAIVVDNKMVEIPLATWWLRHPKRRQQRHVAFTPGRNVHAIYNQWPGFSVAPDFVDSESKCSLYLAHIKNNICRGDAALNSYTIKWMARGVQ